jgi:multiple sugar transport system substrate-binding protein/alpha-glucoside transport system substrate-binding protein
MNTRTNRVFAMLSAGAVLAIAACGGSSSATGGTTSLSGQKVEVAAVWTQAEETNFKAVLDGFTQKTSATYTFTSTGDNIGTVLGTRLAQSNPPDVAILPQPGLMHDLATKGSLKVLDQATQAAIAANYASYWKDLGSDSGKVYGVFFKAANKSTFWYNPGVLKAAGVTSNPKTWADLVKTADTISASGTPPVAVGGADGWTLTDWFENVYLSQAGPDNYDKLTKHQIKWTDPTVATALTTLAQIWGKPADLLGGTQGATSTDFPTSAAAIVGAKPKAGMMYEADFAGGVLAGTAGAKPGTDFDYFPFPTTGSTTGIVGGGDVAVMLKDTPAARALMAYLASPDAANLWIPKGGYTSPNKKADVSKYPDAISAKAAKQLVDASIFKFDMSDQAPAAFGGTKGKGEWADLQSFLAHPTDVAGAQAQLEKDAAAAYGG